MVIEMKLYQIQIKHGYTYYVGYMSKFNVAYDIPPFHLAKCCLIFEKRPLRPLLIFFSKKTKGSSINNICSEGEGGGSKIANFTY